MEQELTPAESLKLIEDMIGQAKRSFHRMSYYFLLWGVLLILAMASQLITAYAGWSDHGYAMGIAGILGGVLSTIHGRREGKREQASTAMDRVLVWLWSAFIITMLTTIVGYGIAGRGTPAGSIMILTGLPTFLTGQMMRFKPLIIGGILFWVLGAVCFYVEPVVMAALYIIAMLFGYVVPGIMLKRQEDGLRTA
jgi:hypothetical protein